MSIDQEIKDLKPFGLALRRENRELFEQMMSVLEQEVLQKASIGKDPLEVITMSQTLQRHKMINELMEK